MSEIKKQKEISPVEQGARKEDILASSPCLRVFLDNSNARSVWEQEIGMAGQEILENLEADLGKDWIEKIGIPLTITIADNETLSFEPEENPELEKLFQIISPLIIMGYEIGNYQDLRLFLEDIFLTLTGREVIIPPPGRKEASMGRIQRFLMIGTYWKRTNSDKLGPFEEFIKEINFERNIDELPNQEPSS